MDDKTKKIAEAQLERASDYQAVFSGPVGERVLEDLKRQHYFYVSCFDKDSLEMARKCGEDDVIKRILAMFNVDVQKSQAIMEARDVEVSKDSESAGG